MNMDKILSELSDIFYETKALEFLIRSLGENPSHVDALVPHEANIGLGITIRRISNKALRIRNRLERIHLDSLKAARAKTDAK